MTAPYILGDMDSTIRVYCRCRQEETRLEELYFWLDEDNPLPQSITCPRCGRTYTLSLTVTEPIPLPA